MTDTESWLERYERNHRNLSYPWIYWAAVPMVMVGAVGFLWSLPVPSQFEDISPLLNWGSAFLMVTTVYYFIISLPIVLAIAFAEMWIVQSDYTAERVSAGLLSAGLIGIWLGHRNTKGFGAMLEDLLLIMIGPAWLLSILYRRMGIPF